MGEGSPVLVEEEFPALAPERSADPARERSRSAPPELPGMGQYADFARGSGQNALAVGQRSWRGRELCGKGGGSSPSSIEGTGSPPDARHTDVVRRCVAGLLLSGPYRITPLCPLF